jgi:hypothetical protein
VVKYFGLLDFENLMSCFSVIADACTVKDSETVLVPILHVIKANQVHTFGVLPATSCPAHSREKAIAAIVREKFRFRSPYGERDWFGTEAPDQ